MNQKTRLALLLILILVIFAAITIILYYSQIIKYQEVYTDVYVVKPGNGAFGLDKEDNIRFGKVAQGNMGERFFNITTGREIKVKIKTEGNISGFLVVSENDFWMEPGETKNLVLSVHIPQDTELGFYSGKIKVYFLKPLFR